MAGIAALAKAQGHEVSGTDANVYPPMSTQLAAQGIKLIQGYDNFAKQPKPDLVIVGNVVSRGNPAIEYILNEKIPVVSGPRWLYKNILQDRWVIAVAGTHGKTTTTSLIAWILEYAGVAPGFLIGGVANDFAVSARLGKSPFFVVEADEYDTAFFDKRSKFVHYQPQTLVINNLEFDHADIFADLTAIKTQFRHLIATVPSKGLIITPRTDPNIEAVLAQGCWTPTQTFALNADLEADWTLTDVKADGSAFKVNYQQQLMAKINWSLLGKHNLNNALTAFAACHHVGIKPSVIAKALTAFKGIKRRLEVRGKVNDITIYDDFAHHPTAIALTLEGLRQHVGKQRILAILEFGSNTMRQGYHGANAFTALKAADLALVMQPQAAWDVKSLAAKATVPIEIALNTDDILVKLSQHAQPGDHIVVMSNTSFDGLHEKILSMLTQHG